jgi:thioredoxin 1
VQVVSSENYQESVVDASSELPVLVDVWGPRCGPCIKMLPWMEGLAEQRSGQLKVVKLDSSENRRLCFDLVVMGLPAVLLYRNGAEVWRLSGDQCTPSGILRGLSACDLSPIPVT